MKSFLQGKKNLEISGLRSPHGPSAGEGLSGAVIRPPFAPAAAAPHVDLVKQGDKIVRIVVTCTCGERTEIECLYPPGQ